MCRSLKTLANFCPPTDDEVRTAHVTLSRARRHPALARHNAIGLRREGVTDIRPESLHSGVEWRVSEQPEARLLLHAPGEISFRLPSGRRRFTGEFGIFEGAYTEGDTDGVEFSVSVVRDKADVEQRVWSVLLDPLTHPADRGTHKFVIDLPDDSVRVIVRTGPGPTGSIAFDWSYLSRMHFGSAER